MTDGEAIHELDRLNAVCAASGWQLLFAQKVPNGFAGLCFPDRRMILVATLGKTWPEILAAAEHEIDHAMRSAIGRGHAQRRTADETFNLICAGAIRVR